jgi:hypothetical protein
MPSALTMAGAASEPSNFAPLQTSRIFTGIWTNRSPLRDASTTDDQARYYGERQDSIIDGYNSEITARLTLKRRPGMSIYNHQVFPPITRFYAWNTFTLTSEAIRVLVDTSATVYDATSNSNTPDTKTAIWQKSPAAIGSPTFFLGVGNNLYFTNGFENKQMNYPGEVVQNWGIVAPTTAPSASLGVYNAYGSWQPNTVFSRVTPQAGVLIVDPNGNIQRQTGFSGITGVASTITWNPNPFQGTTDGTVTWENEGNGVRVSSAAHGPNDLIYIAATDGNRYFYQAQTAGNLAASAPPFQPGLTSITQDGGVQWLNVGLYMNRANIGDNTPVLIITTIIDPNGNVQTCMQAGKTGSTAPSFNSVQSGFTTDPTGNHLAGQAIWQTTGSVGPVQYGFAYKNSQTDDISNMSPASAVIGSSNGQLVNVTGNGSSDPQVDTIVIYRTLHGGSTFLYVDEIAFSGSGTWGYGDTKTDAQLNISIQAQVNGEGTPLPVGATCMEYHLGRIWAAVGNVVYGSSGPDAVVSGSSGNAGFNTTFTCQSKITRLWTSPIGLHVFTVRDVYLIQGDGDSVALFITRYIENIPLLNYDAFTVHLTTPYLFTGKRMVISLDPSSGIVESSFPIADQIESFDPGTAYCTFHSERSGETAMYLANTSIWYRLAPTSAPENGANWSPQARIASGMSAVQSVEVTPGQYKLLIGPPASGGPILQRDITVNTDNGTPYESHTVFGSIVAAEPGQLAGLAWMTLEAFAEGTPPALSILMSEIEGTFEDVPRTRQDPPNLTPSTSLYSNRHSLMQNQRPCWCRHFQFAIDWPAEDAANELLTFTIFGQTWQEMKAQ